MNSVTEFNCASKDVSGADRGVIMGLARWLLNNHLASFIKDILKRWQFWGVFLILVALGLAMRGYLSSRQQEIICAWYRENLAPDFKARIKRALMATDRPHDTAPTTTPTTVPTTMPSGDAAVVDRIMTAIDAYFCDYGNPSTQPTSELFAALPPALRNTITVVPASFVMSLVAVSLLPKPPRKEDVAARFVAAEQTGTQGVAPAAEPGLASVADAYRETSLTARQMRVAVVYAIVSGCVTFAFPPTYVASMMTGGQVQHGIALVCTAFGAALFGAYPFSTAPVKTGTLAWRVGFGPVFFAGLIVSCISLPYQVLRPDEMFPLTRQAVVTIVGMRCLRCRQSRGWR